MTSMAYNAASGFSSMLKGGTKHFSGDSADDASVVIRNMEACMQLCKMVSSSLGPHGRCKLIVNHLGKINVTNDCAAILKEIDVEHPAAQLLAQACMKQEETCGDGTNLVLSLAGELCYNTLDLINQMGGSWRHKTEILNGYKIALDMITTDLLKQNCITEGPIAAMTAGGFTEERLIKLIKPVLMTKKYGSEGILSPLIAKACLSTINKSKQDFSKFNPGSIRTVKILGSAMHNSELIQGFVAQRPLEVTSTASPNTTFRDCKIAVYACAIEASATEAKGTVYMKNATDLKTYNLSEEKKMEDIIKGIAESGCKCMVSGSNVSDMALHFLQRYNIACLRLGSKWELRRLCQAINATALVRLGTPTAEELGFATTVQQKEVGGRKVTIFSNDGDSSDDTGNANLATIILRANTRSILDDLERAVEDGVRACEMLFKQRKHQQLVYGGGACEMSMSIALSKHADNVPGLEQYSIRAFAKSLETVPVTLAQNAGLNSTQIIANLHAAHYDHYTKNDSTNTDASKAICDIGINVDHEETRNLSVKGDDETFGTASMKDKEIYDILVTKLSAIRLAVDATMTVLNIDQIIMSKPSGGPKT